MECNRDEAIKAKTIAEKKMRDKDFAGAKKFTLKAQSLYPELDGISQMLITLNVYISFKNKVNGGEPDWYGVLDVNPSDDEETIRKQYRKLALMVHPDKNKSVGADDAFKILSEAWSLLSDKAKRRAYNQRRRNSFKMPNRTPPPPPPDPEVNGACNHNRTTSPPPPPPDPELNGHDMFSFSCLMFNCSQTPKAVETGLKINLQCPSCAKKVIRCILKMQGVDIVNFDVKKSHVTVKSAIDPKKLVAYITKKTGQHAEVVNANNNNKQTNNYGDAEQREAAGYPNFPPDHVYAPQFLSDENPNACSIV